MRDFGHILLGRRVQQQQLGLPHRLAEGVCLLDAQWALERREQQGCKVSARRSVPVLGPWLALYRTAIETLRIRVIQKRQVDTAAVWKVAAAVVEAGR